MVFTRPTSSRLSTDAVQVERIVLVDKAWARHGVERRPHHIDPAHISDPGWPIRLSTSHADLKTPSDRRSLLRAFLSRGSPAMLLGVHLCGTLSLRAVDLFNDSPSFFFLGLKPCCLPPAFFAQRGDVFGSANGHCFAAKAVAVAGKWQRGKWVGGASRQELQRKFAVWVDNLSRCVECDVEGGGGEGGEEAGGAGRGVVAVEQHRVQSLWRLSSCRETSRDLGTHHRRRCERRFLNDFIFCSRPWAALAPRSATSAAHAAGPEASGTLAAVPAPNRSNGAGVSEARRAAVVANFDEARREAKRARRAGRRGDAERAAAERRRAAREGRAVRLELAPCGPSSVLLRCLVEVHDGTLVELGR